MKRFDVSSMQTSDLGLAALVSSEGIVPAVYLDSEGVETYGVGVTHWAIGRAEMANLPLFMPAPQDINAHVDVILDMFAKILKRYEQMVRDRVTVPLSQNEFDALVHFTYNVGETNLGKSRLLRLINDGQYELAGQSGFHGWLKQTSLRGRRDLESDIFLDANYGAGSIPIYETNGNRKLGRRISAISRDEVVRLIRDPGSRSKIIMDGRIVDTEPHRGPQVIRVTPEVVQRPVARREPRIEDIAMPSPKLPDAVVDLINEVDHGFSKTKAFNDVLKWVSAGGLMGLLSEMDGLFKSVDWRVMIALIAALLIAFVVSIYTGKSRDRKINKGGRARISLRAEGYEV